jgi:hypothetical protein
MNRFAWIGFAALGMVTVAGGCGSSGGGSNFGDDGGTGDDGSTGGEGGTGDDGGPGLDAQFHSDGGEGGTVLSGDPTTCAQAAMFKTYMGCDYWPTVVANNVWSIFDYSVVVANGQSSAVSVTVTGNGQNQTVMVPAGGLQKIYLPWVTSLKGADTDACGTATPLAASVKATGGAYHLVASAPVTVYQFNALEYKPAGGPSGKNWSSCPGNTTCMDPRSPAFLQKVGCFSYSNDASLLLPSTAMTNNYRVTGIHGWGAAMLGAYFAVTATQDNTTVKIHVSSTGQIIAGGGIAATAANGNAQVTLNAGDVAEVLGAAADTSDLSGSLVQSDKPVQVITGVPCINTPLTAPACDHVEESVFPAETLGKDYVVTTPTGPKGNTPGHVLRLYGNVDNTTLTYSPNKPAGCPATLNAGQVADCGTVTVDLRIKGDHEFGVGSFMLGGSLADPGAGTGMEEGDPSQSNMVAIEQWRTKYIFLAPSDYDVSYVDIAGPAGVTVQLDGAAITATFAPIGATGYGVARVKLGAGQNGAHVLTSSAAVGIQVVGYGLYTSYQYPGGLDLQLIAPPPPPPR